MKFFILGDSWGVGEYKIVNKIMVPVPYSGPDYFLSQMGHKVTNISQGSSSNFGQLRHAYQTLKKYHEYDFIIWFHTEPVRDIVETIIDDQVDGVKRYPDFLQIKSYHAALEYVNTCNYEFAQETIYAEFKIPFIVIGGLGRLEDTIYNYEFAKYLIPSWIEEMLKINYKLPRNFLTWHRWAEVFNNFVFDKSEVLAEFEQVQNYQELLKNSNLFPDNGHPCKEEYQKLAYRLLDMLG
jgi:hypothetical protein